MARINLDKLSEKRQYTKEDAKRSQSWFNDQVKYLQNQVSTNSLMNNYKRRKDFFIPGQMYMYFYHPIGVKTLPYYDIFPLVIPFAEDDTTFTAINFHYLPPKVRYVLLKNLLDFANNDKLDEKTRLKLQWGYIGGVSRYAGINAAVKKYRKDHVQSQFLFVPADQWFNAILLPVEKFNTGENMTYIDKSLVWKDSTRYL